ncbi:MAG: LPXTG cell wall anchor domain-containing protein [Akkermansiaceae bacterium]
MDWQTPAALGVVALTVLLFLVKRKKKPCGGNCACPKEHLK